MNKNLRLKIIERFDTQSDFALKVGEHIPKVSGVIRGRLEISDDKKKKWANVLGCNVSDIFPDVA